MNYVLIASVITAAVPLFFGAYFMIAHYIRTGAVEWFEIEPEMSATSFKFGIGLASLIAVTMLLLSWLVYTFIHLFWYVLLPLVAIALLLVWYAHVQRQRALFLAALNGNKENR